MTDPTTPSLDPVEHRLRRTFAARSEDMASGDAAGALPDLGVAGRAAPFRPRWTARPLPSRHSSPPHRTGRRTNQGSTPSAPWASSAATSTPTPGPGLNNVDAAQEVFDRYAGIVRGVLDAQKAFAETIDDPVVRAGAAAYGWGLQLDEQTAQLGRVALLAAVSTGAESIGELSRLHSEVQQGMDAVLAETTGTPYEEAVVTVVGEIEEAGLLDATGAALEGPADIAAILAATDLPAGRGWPAFLDRVEEILAAES